MIRLRALAGLVRLRIRAWWYGIFFARCPVCRRWYSGETVGDSWLITGQLRGNVSMGATCQDRNCQQFVRESNARFRKTHLVRGVL